MTPWMAERGIQVVILILSLTVHEWAHAYAAARLGDDTARRLGRLTLDPFAHLDPIGTLLPLFGAPVGWAKPVPVNPTNFGVNMALGMAITAAAGPASNVVLALLGAGALAAVRAVAPDSAGVVQPAAFALVSMNLGLAAFNLLPVPPLDGSRILEWRLPTSWRAGWDQLQGTGPVLVVVVVLVLPLAGVDLFGPIRDLAAALVSPM